MKIHINRKSKSFAALYTVITLLLLLVGQVGIAELALVAGIVLMYI